MCVSFFGWLHLILQFLSEIFNQNVFWMENWVFKFTLFKLLSLDQYVANNYKKAICRQGGFSCVGRKDRRTCEDELLLHHTNAKINFCNCMYHGFKECKPEGNKPICTKPRSDCMTSVSGYSKTALTRQG